MANALTDFRGVSVIAEIDRRAWAVEQAVALAGALPKPMNDGSAEFVFLEPDKWALRAADQFLAYVDAPIAKASQELLDAARAYDGSQDAGALIGLMADALEGRLVMGGRDG
jgi:hypothetical protein